MLSFPGLVEFSVVGMNAAGERVVIRIGQASPDLIPAQAFNPGEIAIVGSTYAVGSVLTDDGVVEPKRLDASVSVAQVKAEQGRRLKYTDWLVTRAADPTDGRPVPPEVLGERERIRAAAKILERLDPIPPDYRDSKYWL